MHIKYLLQFYYKFRVDSFVTYAYGCRIYLLEFVVVFNAYVANESTLSREVQEKQLTYKSS